MSPYSSGSHGASLWDSRPNTLLWQDTYPHIHLLCLYLHQQLSTLGLTSLRKYLVHQGVSVSARSLSSFLCRSSRARLCSVALSMSPSRRDSVTCCHSLLQTKFVTLVFRSFLSLQPHTAEQDHCTLPSTYTGQTDAGQNVMVQHRWKGLWPSLTSAAAVWNR